MGTGYLILPARFRVSRRRLHLTSAHYLILPARFRVSRRHLHLTSPFPLKMRRFARKKLRPVAQLRNPKIAQLPQDHSTN